MPINNTGSFFNNFQNGFVFMPKNLQNNNLEINNNLQKLLENVSSVQKQINSEPKANVLPRTTEQLASTVNELAKLNDIQTTEMIKDLVKFPKQFEQFIVNLMTNTNSQQTLLSLINTQIDLSKLAQVLQNSSKEAQTNLYRMLADYNQMGLSLKSEEVEHLTKIISLLSSASASEVQSLKTVLLMYLPWLPLNNPDILKLETAPKSNSDEQLYFIDSIGVLMSTKNYGNLQAQILKTDEDGIKIEVISSETFPLESFTELMKQEGKHYNININFDFARKEAFNKEKIEASETKIFLNTSPGVNPFLLLISNALIKIVHELDIKESDRWHKKEILENGKS